MIIRTTKTINKVEYDYTYSDAVMYIKRNDICYTEAIDPLNSNREYEETDISIVDESDDIVDSIVEDMLDSEN